MPLLRCQLLRNFDGSGLPGVQLQSHRGPVDPVRRVRTVLLPSDHRRKQVRRMSCWIFQFLDIWMRVSVIWITTLALNSVHVLLNVYTY